MPLLNIAPYVGPASYGPMVTSCDSRKHRNRESSSCDDMSLPALDYTLRDLEESLLEVQTIRAQSRLLSPEEVELRKRLGELIKHLERQSRKRYDRDVLSDLRGARQMRDRLNGIPGPPRSVSKGVMKDWAETRDYSKPAPRRAGPRGGIARVVTGGSPGLGKRK